MKKSNFTKMPDFVYQHIGEMLEEVSVRYPKNTALQMKTAAGNYRTLDYTQVKQNVSILGSYLLSRGFTKGDHIGILAENSIEWCLAYLAITVYGFICVPIEATLQEKEIVKIAEYSDIKAIFFSSRMMEKATEIEKQVPKISDYIILDTPESSPGFSFTPVQDIFSKKLEVLPFTSLETDGNDTISIIFTSGTTGLSKGVMLTHRGITANVNASIQSLPIDETDNFITVLPLHHTYPATCSFLSPLTVGGTTTIAESLVGSKLLANIKETKATIMIGVPLLYDKIKHGLQNNFRSQSFGARLLLSFLRGISTFFTKVLGIPAGKKLFAFLRKKAGLNSLRLLVAGGGPLQKATADFFQILGFNIVQGYGMSENGPLIATNLVEDVHNESVGYPVKYTDIQIREPNASGIGEIVVKSPSLMQGYFKNPEATEQIFTEDGYLKTGDLGIFDTRGRLYIKGRKKNIIVTEGGKNIFPEEIEAYFNNSRIIGEIMITGRKKGPYASSEEVIAVCVPDYEYLEEHHPDDKSDNKKIRHLIKDEIETVNRQLEGYKKIYDFILREEPFEKTSSEKIKRYLYTEYSAPVESSAGA